MTKEERYEQEELVHELIWDNDMDEEEFDEKYNSLSPEFQQEVDEGLLKFADDAIGSESWRSDW